VLPGNAGLDLRVQRVYSSAIYPGYQNDDLTIEEDSWAGIGWKLHFGRELNPDAGISTDPTVGVQGIWTDNGAMTYRFDPTLQGNLGTIIDPRQNQTTLTYTWGVSPRSRRRTC
jgi:hypothetical protein